MSISEILPNLLVGLCSIGLAAAFFFADPRSPTTRALALGLFANGWEFAQSPYVYSQTHGLLRYFDLLLVAIAGVAFIVWLQRVAQTAQTSDRAMRWITRCVRMVQLLAVAFLATSWVYIDAASTLFSFQATIFADPVQRIIALQLVTGVVIYMIAGTILFMQKVDPVEKVRASALACAAPFLLAGMLMPIEYAALSNMLGQIVFLIGAVRYHAMQGQRAQFMSKFLSPQVEKLVRLKGMAYALRPSSLEITIVCCDLRGFTRFSQLHSSEQVVELLREYYEAVGSIVARMGATIKDYAGDGILILVGAPLKSLTHASDGLALAREVSAAARAVARRWGTTLGHD